MGMFLDMNQAGQPLPASGDALLAAVDALTGDDLEAAGKLYPILATHPHLVELLKNLVLLSQSDPDKIAAVAAAIRAKIDAGGSDADRGNSILKNFGIPAARRDII